LTNPKLMSNTNRPEPETPRHRVYRTIQKAEAGDKHSTYFDNFIIVLILLNVVAVLLATDKQMAINYEMVFSGLEWVSVIVFTIEYGLRVWTCVESDKYNHPLWSRIKYIFSLESIIDLLAIAPFYILMFVPLNMDVVNGLRLLRLLRIFKLGRYMGGVSLILAVIKSRREELFITFSTVIILLIFSSTLMYYLENKAQPDQFSSIPATMWWGVATLTTVGYGDIYPITAMGKMLGAAIAILGIGVFALPAGIIATGFESEIQRRKKEKKKQEKKQHKQTQGIVCEQCGHVILAKSTDEDDIDEPDETE